MAYETGTASSPTDLLQKLVTWLVARGWASNMSQADGTGWRAHLSKGSAYINLRATPGNVNIWGHSLYTSTATAIGIGLYMGTGYSGAAAWNAQAGGPIGNGETYTVGSFMQTPSGAMTAYHFFDDGSDNVLVVVERTSGIFTHMGWGTTLAKAGAWTGGTYFFGAMSGYASPLPSGIDFQGAPDTTAACPASHSDAQNCAAVFVRTDVDAFTGKWVGMSPTVTASQGYTGKIGAGAIHGFTSYIPPDDIPKCQNTFLTRQVSALNSQANLVPVRLYAQRDSSGYSLLGSVPSVFASNASSKGFAIGSTFSIGSDTYMVFPNFVVKRV